jgi:hypothetical protein
MSKNIGLLKGKVVIEDQFAESEQELLIKKYKSKTEFEFWRTKHKSLTFLKDLPELEILSLIGTKIENADFLSEIPKLKTLFLNAAKFDAGWNFLANLNQIEELHILNIRGKLILPDLKMLDHLKSFRIWSCKGLADISVLENVRQLEEVDLVDTSVTLEKLLPLIKKSSVKYINATFSSKKDRDLFQEYVDRHGKRPYKVCER